MDLDLTEKIAHDQMAAPSSEWVEPAHPALQGMVGETPKVMLIILALAVIGMMVLVALSFLPGS